MVARHIGARRERGLHSEDIEIVAARRLLMGVFDHVRVQHERRPGALRNRTAERILEHLIPEPSQYLDDDPCLLLAGIPLGKKSGAQAEPVTRR